MESLSLLLVAADVATSRHPCRASSDAAALRVRGHDVKLFQAPPLAGTTSEGADVVFTYGWSAAAWAVRDAAVPHLHLGTGPTTDRAAGAPPELLRHAYGDACFKAVDSHGAQRDVLLEYGGRCWVIPPGLPPSCFEPPPAEHAALRVGVLDPYPSPIAWVDELTERLDDDPHVSLERIAFDAPGSRARLMGVDLVLIPSRGEADGSTSLVLWASAMDRAVLMADSEPFHALVPVQTSACFVPTDDVEAVVSRLRALAREPAQSLALLAVSRDVRNRHSMPRRIDALEGALQEILDAAHRPNAAPTSMWLPAGEDATADHRYTFASQFAPCRRVLDLACGDGRGSVHLADAGARSVVGVDASEVAVARAERLRARDRRLCFACMPIDALDLPSASVDLVVAFGVADGHADASGIIAEAARVLAPNGTLLMSIENARGASHDPGISHGTCELATLREQLELAFGRVTYFAERIDRSGVTIRGESLDPERDAAWIAMATRPTRSPVDSESPERVSRHTLRRRAA